MTAKINYFSIVFSLIILYLSYLLMKPFLGALISAITISYIMYPFYSKINEKIKNKNLSLIVALIIIIFLLLLPLTVVAYSLLDDMANFLMILRNLRTESLSFLPPEAIPLIQNYFVGIIENLTSGLLSMLSQFVSRLPERLINLFVFLLAIPFFLKEGPDLIKKFRISLPIDKEEKKALLEEFEIVTKGMVYSIFFSSLYNAIVGGLVFYIFGIPNALLWSFLMGILAFIPLIGNVPVWIGGSLYLFFYQKYFLAVLLFLIQVLVANVDGLLVTNIAGKKSKINSLLVLIGIVSGIRVFGPIGIIFGPLILSVLISLIRFYTKDYKKKFEF
ncbi:MAG: AI-2E family transporter [Candidatus Aenigmarchaeota archaeon]|nr:AI-2E family transporter [Candidatus Aenigmarchaeota archaeon]